MEIAFIVTAVFRALLSSTDTFSTAFSAWSNTSLHALNSLFALLSPTPARAAPRAPCSNPPACGLFGRRVHHEGEPGVLACVDSFLRFPRFSSPLRGRLCGAGGSDAPPASRPGGAWNLVAPRAFRCAARQLFPSCLLRVYLPLPSPRLNLPFLLLPLASTASVRVCSRSSHLRRRIVADDPRGFPVSRARCVRVYYAPALCCGVLPCIRPSRTPSTHPTCVCIPSALADCLLEIYDQSCAFFFRSSYALFTATRARWRSAYIRLRARFAPPAP
ncbi:hypothetical protein FB451DRAFT_170498 [Mycena latifolia]|nr:hypothetical protein FB451DRAFT_170498 [Mycena latifolia]